VVQHTESSDTLCSITDQILIWWCEANHLHPAGPLLQKRLADELLRSQSQTCSCPVACGAMVNPLHGVPHSAQAPS
jgi:hypothetical protein